MTRLVARAVTVRAGERALVDGASLAVAAGEVVALVGPNGAGKSTLLAALAGDRPLDGGEVTFDGRPVTAMPLRELARRRAVLPQRPALAASYSALEVVMLGLVDPVRVGGGDDARRIAARHHLDAVGVGHLAGRAYPTLSGGEQQRVQLARVLAQLGELGGRVLLLDEPTAALDPRHQHAVLARARRAAEDGHAVVVVLHDLSLAARWADRIALLHRGRLVRVGSPEEVLERSLLRAVFEVDLDLIPHPGGRGLCVVSAPLES